MAYLIDTDWVIDHLGGVPPARQLLASLAEEGIAISVITYMEAYEGVLRSPSRQEAETKFRVFVEIIPVLPLSLAVARRCARLRDDLRKQGKRMQARALDLIIAATALEHEFTLVTRNLDDYQEIGGLKVL